MEYQELKTNADILYLVRQSLFDGEYLLTDYTDIYGKLIYDGFARRTGLAYSALKNWRFDYDFEPYSKREILIYDGQDCFLGKVIQGYGYLTDSPSLVLTNGFKAQFIDRSILFHEYEWFSDKNESIMQIKSPMFSLTDTINVITRPVSDDLILLLCFLAAHILILRGRSRNDSY